MAYGLFWIHVGGNMASSSSVTGKNTPHDAPLLRQPPPSLDELARCNEEIGLLKPEDWPQVDHLVTEDDTPVDNIYAEKQQRLLTQSLYDAWQGPGAGRPFIAMAIVGLFYGINRPPQVPDVLVSLDVALPADIWTKRHRSYMIWEYGKPPEIVIEIVANKIDGEDDVLPSPMYLSVQTHGRSTMRAAAPAGMLARRGYPQWDRIHR
jgi:hypothetical protein